MVILYTVSLWKKSFPKKRSGRQRGDDERAAVVFVLEIMDEGGGNVGIGFRKDGAALGFRQGVGTHRGLAVEWRV